LSLSHYEEIDIREGKGERERSEMQMKESPFPICLFVGERLFRLFFTFLVRGEGLAIITTLLIDS